MDDKPTVYNKGRFQLKFRGTVCLNCGQPLDISDRYCPNCAQANSTKKVSLADFFDEFFSNIISLDSRLYRTISSMILRPGMITKEYIQGKRMRYANPFRFMLSLAIIYFVMLEFTGDFSNLDRLGNSEKEISFDPGSAFNLIVDDESQDAAEARKLIDSLDVDVGDRIAAYNNNRDSMIVSDPSGYFGKITGASLMERIGKKQQFFSTLLQKDSIAGFQDAIEKFGVTNNLENRTSFSIARSTLRVAHQPGTFLNDVISNLPFVTFFFLPIFTVFIVLVYIRKKYTYTDNLIFSFHNQSLLFILLIVSFLIDSIFSTSTAWIALTVFSIWLYIAMRNFYGQGHFKTIIKYLFLNMVFFILAGIAGIITILASVFTY